MRKVMKNSIAFWPMMVRPSFQGRRAFIAAFPNENWKMSIKKSSLHNGNWFRNFSSCLCQSLYDVKQKAQQELCVPLGDGTESLKGSHRMGNCHIFLKASVPFFLINTYQMSLHSAGSILLDSTFTIFHRWKFRSLLDLSRRQPCLPELVVGMTQSE